jgi:hypothetical protein
VYFLNINPLFIISKHFYFNIIATISTDLSTIILIVKTLEVESNCINRFDVRDLREYISNIRPFNLARL